MVLPTEILIKQEKEEYETDSAEYLSPEFEVVIKVEVENSLIPAWEVKTEFTGEKKSVSSEVDYETSDEVFNGTGFEELKEYNPLRCDICNKQFFERYSLIQHNLDHLKLYLELLHQCPFCLKHYPAKNKLTAHIEAYHNGMSTEKDNFKVTKTLHQCNICGRIQAYKRWHSHMREVHSTDIYECGICNTVFKCSRYLRRHNYTVHMNKKFKSGVSNPIEQKCTMCPRVLNCKNALKTHMRNCHSEKAQCEICKSVLKSQSYLNTHMRRVHYNDGKEYRCFCGKAFHSPRYLKVHKKNAHSR